MSFLRIRMEKSGSWKISNFSSHVRVKHAEYDIPGDFISQQPKKRPCDSHLETTPEDTPWTAMATPEAYETEYLEISQQSCSQTSTVAAVLTNENDREVRRTCEDGPPTYVLQHLVVKRMKYEDSDPFTDDEGNQCSFVIIIKLCNKWSFLESFPFFVFFNSQNTQCFYFQILDFYCAQIVSL